MRSVYAVEGLGEVPNCEREYEAYGKAGAGHCGFCRHQLGQRQAMHPGGVSSSNRGYLAFSEPDSSMIVAPTCSLAAPEGAFCGQNAEATPLYLLLNTVFNAIVGK